MRKPKRIRAKRGFLIFRAWITVKGQRLYARDYGLRAWPIWVRT